MHHSHTHILYMDEVEEGTSTTFLPRRNGLASYPHFLDFLSTFPIIRTTAGVIVVISWLHNLSTFLYFLPPSPQVYIDNGEEEVKKS